MKDVAKVWTFESSSSKKEYETLQYTDGSTSCNCPGWTRRVAADGSRTCKHTRMVDQGIADTRAVSFHEYGPSIKKAAGVQKTHTVPRSSKNKSKVVSRKIQW